MSEREIIKFLNENIKVKPKKIIDVCCGYGNLVGALSSNYPDSQVYGLDINRESLAYGIARRHFKRATPIHGDAYDLTEDNPDFSLVKLKPPYYKDGRVDWMELQHEKFEERVEGFDLVTAVNPSDELTEDEVNELIAGEDLKRGHVPVSIVSAPCKKGGHLLYETEVACHASGLWGGADPKNLSEQHVKNYLKRMKKGAEVVGLEIVNNCLVGDSWATDVAILYRKP